MPRRRSGYSRPGDRSRARRRNARPGWGCTPRAAIPAYRLDMVSSQRCSLANLSTSMSMKTRTLAVMCSASAGDAVPLLWKTRHRTVPAAPQIIRYMRIELPRSGGLSPVTPDLIFRATRPSGWNGSREMADKTQDQQFRTAAAKPLTRLSGTRLKGRRSPSTEPPFQFHLVTEDV
jgi:hypothetical protein